jgi:ubiquinone/menaquinone biosynthesis C-methylase UbiE
MQPTERFTDRVENYSKYRPSYPAEIITFLAEEIGLDSTAKVADIGSGTGLFTELLIENNNRVYAVEPNAAMRKEAERLFGRYRNFFSIDGTAESTTLEDESVEVITCAQAFHWFDIPKTRKEFQRILDPDGYVVLLWNDRKTDSSPFLKEYEALLHKHGTDYKEVSRKWAGTEAGLDELYGDHHWKHATFQNDQLMDKEGMLGRLLSSSYVPNSGEALEKMIADFSDLYDRSKSNDIVTFEYITNVYYGHITLV